MTFASTEGISTLASRERAFMRKVAALLSANTTLEHVFEHLCEALADVVDASVVFIALRHPDGKIRLEYMHDHGIMRRMPGLEVPEGSSTHQVMQSGKTILRRTESEWPPGIDHTIPTPNPNNDSASAVYAPLRFGEQTLGVLSVQSPAENSYTEDDAHLIEAVARYLATAVKGRWIARTPAPARRWPLEYLAVVMAALAATVALFAFANVREDDLRAAALTAQTQRAATIAARTESMVLEVRQLVRSEAAIIAPLRRDPKDVQAALLSFLGSAPAATVYGVGAWFAPYTFDPARKYFGPYAHRALGGGNRLVLTYEWSNAKYDYPRQPWYAIGRQSGSNIVFTQPYFDTDLIYVSALRRLTDARGSFTGMVSVDMVLPQLREFVPFHTSEPGEIVYVTTADGRPFVVRDERLLLREARAAHPSIKTILDVDAATLQGFIARTYAGPRTERVITVPLVGWHVHVSSEDRVLFGAIAAFHAGIVGVTIGLWIVVVVALAALRQRRFHLRRARRLEMEKAQLEHEIGERQRAEEQLRRFAYTDALTGLPNRAFTIDALRHAIERYTAGRDIWFAAYQIDLDRFNVVNDSLGHGTGDRLLIAAGERLRGLLHENDLVARIGGDEFMIVVQSIGGALDPMDYVHRIERAFDQPFLIDDHEVFTSVSIGIAVCETGYDAPEDMIRDADIAVHRAKRGTAQRHAVFDKVMHHHAVARLKLENELRKAIEREEFFLVYQPVLSLGARRTVGFEALIRWNHPERGQLGPAAFIETAEQTRLIVPIGRWILREACRQIGEWARSGAPALWVSVNISAAQYEQPDLISDVIGAITHSGVPRSALKLEITESAIMSDASATVRTLNEFRRIGVRTQIDDFGTGYSSLSYLQQFPVDTLKIDQSFVARMVDDQDSYEIVRAIVTLAKTLRLELTAEGIETDAHLQALGALGVDHGQGYLFSKPILPDEAIAFASQSALVYQSELVEDPQ